MARSKKSTVEIKPLTREEQIAKARAEFSNSYNRAHPNMIAAADRQFTPGQHVQVGSLEECVVVETFNDGKAVIVEYRRAPCRTIPDPAQQIGAWWWFDCIWDPPVATKEYVRPYRRGQVSTSTIDSLIHMYGHEGLVCNPEYQRGYVWTQFDQEQLIDSIFDRLTIGSFVFIRNHGYLHKGKTGTVRYVTLDGKEMVVDVCNNDAIEVIDGQQRITTIIKFITGQITYRGFKFQELSYADRRAVLETSFTYRLINEEDVSRTEILEMFLQVNRGVPQNTEHLDKVRKLYENELAKTQESV